MSEIKIYKISGEITKPNFKTSFVKEIKALKPEHAVENIYKIFGSKNRVKRSHIKITSIEEVPIEEAESI